jgi:PadR family transcriptional regulator, regulatory protein PadR
MNHPSCYIALALYFRCYLKTATTFNFIYLTSELFKRNKQCYKSYYVMRGIVQCEKQTSQRPRIGLQDKWEIQLRKGTLELVILAALKNRQLYGLELLKLLQEFKSAAIAQGTLYPLLHRLKCEGLLLAEWVQQGETRPRKYDQLTVQGCHKLDNLTQLWRQSVSDIEFLMQHPGPDVLTKKGV